MRPKITQPLKDILVPFPGSWWAGPGMRPKITQPLAHLCVSTCNVIPAIKEERGGKREEIENKRGQQEHVTLALQSIGLTHGKE